MRRQDQQDPLQKQRSCYQFTIRINTIKLNVKFPCNMVLKFDSQSISPQVNKSPPSMFNFQHEIILKDSLKTGRFQIGVFLLTQKRQNSMIVNNNTERSQISTNTIFAGQIKLEQQKMMTYQGRSFDIGLTNCLDNSATCNLTVLRVNNLQLLRNGRHSVHKISDNEQSRMSRVQSSSILKHLGPKQASQISNEISSSIEKIRLRIDSRSKAQLHTPSTLSNFRQSAVEYRSQRSRENGKRVDSSTSLRPPLSPKGGYYLEKYSSVPTGAYPNETNRARSREGPLQLPTYEHINSHLKIDNPRSSSNERKIQLALERSQQKRSIQVNRLKTKIEELQKTLHVKDRQVKQQKDKINQLLQQNQSNKYFQQQLNSKNTHIQSQQNIIKSLRQQNQSLKLQILQLQRQQQLMKQSLMTQRDNLNNEIQNLKQEHYSEMKKKQSSINQLEYELEVKSTQSSKMKRMIEELQERLDQKTFQTERDIRMLKQDNKRKIDHLNSVIKGLQQSLKSQAIKKTQLQAQIQRLKQLIISKQKQFYTSFHQITFNTNNKSRINYDPSNLGTINKINNNPSFVMQSQFIENNLNPKGSEMNWLPRNQQLQQKYFEVMKQNKLLKIDILSLNTTIESLKKDNSNLNKQLADIKAKIHQYKQQPLLQLNFGQQKYSQNDNFTLKRQLLSLKEQNEYLQQKLQSANNKLFIMQNKGSPSRSILKASKLLFIQDKKQTRSSKISNNSVQDSAQQGILSYRNQQNWKQLIKDKNKQITMLERQVQLLRMNQSGKQSLHRKTIQLKDFMIRQLEERLKQKDNEIMCLKKNNIRFKHVDENNHLQLQKNGELHAVMINHVVDQQQHDHINNIEGIINKSKLQTEFEKLSNILDNIQMNSNINLSQVEYFRNQINQKDKEIQTLKDVINKMNNKNNNNIVTTKSNDDYKDGDKKQLQLNNNNFKNTSSISQTQSHQQPCQQHDFILQSYRLQNEQLQKQNKQLLNRLKQQQRQFMLRIQQIEQELKRGNNSYKQSLSKIDQGSNVEESFLDQKLQSRGRGNSYLLQEKQKQSKIKQGQQSQGNVFTNQQFKLTSQQLQKIQPEKQQIIQNLVTNPTNEQNKLQTDHQNTIQVKQTINKNQSQKSQTIQQLQNQLQNNKTLIEKYKQKIKNKGNQLNQLKLCLNKLIDLLKNPQINNKISIPIKQSLQMKQKLIEQVENKIIAIEELQSFNKQQLSSLQQIQIEGQQHNLNSQDKVKSSDKSDKSQSHANQNINKKGIKSQSQKMRKSSQWRSLPLPQNISQPQQSNILRLPLDPLMVGMSQSQLQQNILMQQEIKQLCQTIYKLENELEVKNNELQIKDEVIHKYELKLQSKQQQLSQMGQLLQVQKRRNKLLKSKLKEYCYQGDNDIGYIQQQSKLKQDNNRVIQIVDDIMYYENVNTKNESEQIQQKKHLRQEEVNNNKVLIESEQNKQYDHYKQLRQDDNGNEIVESNYNISRESKVNQQQQSHIDSVQQSIASIESQNKCRSSIVQIGDDGNNNINNKQMQKTIIQQLLKQIDHLKNNNQQKQGQIQRLKQLCQQFVYYQCQQNKQGNLLENKQTPIHQLQKGGLINGNNNNNKLDQQSLSSQKQIDIKPQQQQQTKYLQQNDRGKSQIKGLPLYNTKIEPFNISIKTKQYYKKKTIKQPFQMQLYQHLNDNQNNNQQEQVYIQINNQIEQHFILQERQIDCDGKDKQSQQRIIGNQQQQRHQQLNREKNIRDQLKQQYQLKQTINEEGNQMNGMDRSKSIDSQYNQGKIIEQAPLIMNEHRLQQSITNQQKQQQQVLNHTIILNNQALDNKNKNNNNDNKDNNNDNKDNNNDNKDNNNDNTAQLMLENRRLRQQLQKLKQKLNQMLKDNQGKQQLIRIQQQQQQVDNNKENTQNIQQNLIINDNNQLILFTKNNNNKIKQLQLKIQQLYQQLYQLQYHNHHINNIIKFKYKEESNIHNDQVHQREEDKLNQEEEDKLNQVESENNTEIKVKKQPKSIVNNKKSIIKNQKSICIQTQLLLNDKTQHHQNVDNLNLKVYNNKQISRIIYRISQQDIDQQHSHLSKSQNQYSSKYQYQNLSKQHQFNRGQFESQNSVINIVSPFRQEEQYQDQSQQESFKKEQVDQKYANRIQRCERKGNEKTNSNIDEGMEDKKQYSKSKLKEQQQFKSQQKITNQFSNESHIQQWKQQIQQLKNKIKQLQQQLSSSAQLKINPSKQQHIIERHQGEQQQNHQGEQQQNHQEQQQNISTKESDINNQLIGNKLNNTIHLLQKQNKTYFKELVYLREQFQKIKNLITVVMKSNNDFAQQTNNNRIDSKLSVFNYQNSHILNQHKNKNNNDLQYSNQKQLQHENDNNDNNNNNNDNNNNNNSPFKRQQQNFSALEVNNNNKHQRQQLSLNKQSIVLKQLSNRKLFFPPTDSLVYSQTQINLNIKKQHQQHQQKNVVNKILRLVDNVLKNNDNSGMKMVVRQQIIQQNCLPNNGQDYCCEQQLQQQQQDEEQQDIPTHITTNNKDKQNNVQNIKQLLISDIQTKQQLKQMILQLIDQKQLISQKYVDKQLRLIEVQTQLNSYKHKIDSIKQQYIYRQQVISSISKDLHEFNVSMDTNQQSMSMDELLVGCQHQIVQTKREELIEHRYMMQMCSQNNKGLQMRDFQVNSNQVKLLRQKYSQLQTQNVQYQQKLSNLQCQTKQLKQIIEKYQQSENNYKLKITQYQQRINNYQQQITNYQQQINTLITQLKQSNQQLRQKDNKNNKSINYPKLQISSQNLKESKPSMKNQISSQKSHHPLNQQQQQSKYNNNLNNQIQQQSKYINNNQINQNKSNLTNQSKTIANLINQHQTKINQHKKERVTSPRITGSIGMIKKIDTNSNIHNNININSNNRLKKSSTNIINNNSQ